MKTQIIRNLKRLASLTYQQRYCIAATADEYALPVEIYEQTVSIIKLVLSNEMLSHSLSVVEKKSLYSFLKEVETIANQIPFYDSTVSLSTLIEQSSEWAKIRTAAKQCLTDIGCSDDLSVVCD